MTELSKQSMSKVNLESKRKDLQDSLSQLGLAIAEVKQRRDKFIIEVSEYSEPILFISEVAYGLLPLYNNLHKAISEGLEVYKTIEKLQDDWPTFDASVKMFPQEIEQTAIVELQKRLSEELTNLEKVRKTNKLSVVK